jgi:SNF2 family DNA or RNA helicase
MGCGKTWLGINTAAERYRRGDIEALIVIAPNGVTRNWIVEELPAHMPDDVKWSGLVWDSKKASRKYFRKSYDDLRRFAGLKVFTIHYEATITAKGKAATEYLLNKFRCMVILDESDAIKTPGAKRTKRIIAWGRRAAIRRTMTGTPIGNAAFDIYAQYRFLDQDYWKRRGFRTFADFRHHFGIYQRRTRSDDASFDQFIGYQRLDELQDHVSSISTRVQKDDVLDLPPKVYEKRFTTMAYDQRRRYDLLREEFIYELQQEEVDIPLALTRLLRLQQILSGFWINADGEAEIIPKPPRIDTLLEAISAVAGGKSIIWARFTYDIDIIMSELARAGISAVRYDGQTTSEDRAEAIEKFQRGDAQCFVANPDAAGTGLTLHAASFVVYYSNNFKLTKRLQSEDRAHRIGQTKSVTYIDIVCEDSVDERIVETLRRRRDIAAEIVGDDIGEWI